MSRRVLLIGSVVVLVAASVVTGVVLATTSSSDDAADSPLDAAMGVLPADADIVTFTDVAAGLERLGHGDLTSESPKSAYDAYLEDSAESPWAASLLMEDYERMDGWGWNFTDVEWEATYDGHDVSATAFKLRDGLDMATVEASFEEIDYDRSEVDGYPAYTVNFDEEDNPSVLQLLSVVVLPDKHLVLAGPDPEALVGAATGEAETVADTGPARDLMAAVSAPEYLSLWIGQFSCLDPAVGLDEETAGVADLHDPIGHVAAVTTEAGEPAATAVAAYEDADTASADVAPRRDFVDDAASVDDGEPYAEMFDVEVDSDGALVRYDLAGDDAPRDLPGMVLERDLPWGFCAK